MQKPHLSTRNIATTAMLAAVAALLFYIQIPVPFMPSFIQLDLSELPALLASFSLGPGYGVAVCFLKNLIHLPVSTTGCVGELSNFLLGTALVLPAGLLYRYRRNRKIACVGCIGGALLMGLLSVPINYFLTYPIYQRIRPIDAIIEMYQAILPSVDGLLACLLVFNLPFTVMKGLLNAVIVMLIYKPLSPVMKGRRPE